MESSHKSSSLLKYSSKIFFYNFLRVKERSSSSVVLWPAHKVFISQVIRSCASSFRIPLIRAVLCNIPPPQFWSSIFHVLISTSSSVFLSIVQGSKLGWSCGPSLPKLQSDHQIVLSGGPVVYWKTHHKRTVFNKN